MDEPDQHAGLVIKQAHRPFRQSCSHQEAVERTSIAQDHDPAVGAHDDADESRQDDKKFRQRLARAMA
jgi:hypothetical protein